VLKKQIAILITAALLITATVISYAKIDNYLFNGSFEQLIKEAPANWTMDSYDKSAGATTFEVQTSDPQLGEKYVTITNNVLNDSRYVQPVKVEANKKYKLSCYIKTENVSEEGAGANLSIANQTVTSRQIKGTSNGWEYVELYAATESGVDTIKVTVGLGGYSAMSTGKASFDNVVMEEVEEIPEGAPCAVMNSANAGSDTDADNNSGNNSDNSNNNGNNSSPQNSEGNSGKVVVIVLILSAVATGVAVFNTSRANKKNN